MRRRILQLYERGKRTREIAHFLVFCVAAVRRVRQQFRQRGSCSRGLISVGVARCLPRNETATARTAVHQPDATLAELGARMDRPFRTSRSIYGFGNWVGGIKKLCSPPNKIGRTWPKKELTGMNSWLQSLCLNWYSWMKAGQYENDALARPGLGEEDC